MSIKSDQLRAGKRAIKDGDTSRKVLGYYNELEKEIDKKIRILYEKTLKEVNPEDYYKYLREKNRLDSLLLEIQRVQLFYQGLINEEIETGARISFINSYYYQSYIASTVIPSYTFTLIDLLAVEIAVYHTDKRWATIKSIGRKNKLRQFRIANSKKPTLVSLLVAKKQRDLEKIKDVLVKGLISGQSYPSMSNQIKINTALNYKNAKRIVRTETNTNLNASNYYHTLQMQEQGIGSKRQILSVKDARTRLQSQIVDGQIEGDDGYFVYPGGVKVLYPGSSGVQAWDINDRETVVNTYEGFPIQAQRARNPITGKNEIIDFNVNYTDWMKMHNLTRLKSGEVVSKDPKLQAQQLETIRLKRKRGKISKE